MGRAGVQDDGTGQSSRGGLTVSTLSSLQRTWGVTEEEALAVARSARSCGGRDYGYQGYLHPGRYLGHHKARNWQKRRRNKWIRRHATRDVVDT